MHAANDVFSTFWRVIDRLEHASIEYMLTGSLALNCYGHARATNDIDIVILVTPTDAERLFRLFADDFYVSPEAISDAFQSTGMFNLIDNATIFKIDLILAKDDPFAQQQFRRRRRVPVDDREVAVIAPEDLILAKLDWSKDSHSEMQTRDIRNIIQTMGQQLDRAYLDRWAKQQGHTQRLEEIDATS